jgi:GNAT superfamily N-acetyltransferase
MTTGPFTIRATTREDVPLLIRFIRELSVYEKLAHDVTATEELLRDNLFDRRRAAEAVLAFEGERAVGFALYFHNFSTFVGKPGLYLEDVYVLPDCRGRGYGKALMVHLARIAVARDCGRFEWWVLDWNEPSIRFYRSLGAIGMDDWTVQRVAGDALTQLAAHPLPGET